MALKCGVEPYNEGGPNQDRVFTGQTQDTTSGVYDYLFRKYDPTAGRWLSPDPAGWAVVDQTTPQSLNRYAYVLNNPMVAIDPAGLILCMLPTDSNGGVTIDDVQDEDACWSAGGYLYTANQTVEVTDPDATCSPSDPVCAAENYSSSVYASSWILIGPPSQYPDYQPLFCLGDALKSNGTSLALDALGLLPEGGAVAGAFSAWHGAAGVSNGIRNLQAVKMGAGIIGTASSSQEGKLTATAVGVASIVTSLARAAPIYGQLLSLTALTLDVKKIRQEQTACEASGKHN